MAASSAIIVTYQSRDLIAPCLRALEGQADEVIVVDNASTDGTRELVAEQFPTTRLIANHENRGFAFAINQGLISARGDYLLLLNPDTAVQPGEVAELSAALDAHPEIGLLGPQLRDARGSVVPSCTTTPTLRILLIRATALSYLLGTRAAQRRYEMASRDWNEPGPVGVVSGACLMARREAVAQVGSFDESLFLYFEDDDWSLRMRRAGWQVWYWPRAVVTHLGHASTDQCHRARIRRIHLRSAAHYLGKHFGPWAAFVFRAAILANSLLLAPVRLFTDRRR